MGPQGSGQLISGGGRWLCAGTGPEVGTQEQPLKAWGEGRRGRDSGLHLPILALQHDQGDQQRDEADGGYDQSQ